MAGYIFALGKDNPLSIYERCAKDGVYSTSLFTLSSIPFEGTLADYSTMKEGDNVYFFFERKIYGIGTLKNIGKDCKYSNYLCSNIPKHFYYNDIKNHLLVDYGPQSTLNRWICCFSPSPYFFRQGVDMDDILVYKPNTFKMLRAFWKTSFIKISDEENRSLKEIIMLRNKDAVTAPTSNNILEGNSILHEKIKNTVCDQHLIDIKHVLDACNTKNHIRHEMAIEAATLHQLSRDPNTVFGKWDYLSHQVPASPFKPIDYMDKIDIFGYRFIDGTDIVSKYLVIEIKKGTADISAITQLAKYVDWVCKEYAYGDYSALEGYILAYDYTEEAIRKKNDICVRQYTQGSHPIENKEWIDIKLIKYSYDDGCLQYTEEPNI